MQRKEWNSHRGRVVYWVSDEKKEGAKTLAFLPGLSAEHHLFDPQLDYFDEGYNCFTWDAPGHALSRPYAMDFSLEEIADALHKIFAQEGIHKPVLIGQSFGAYIGQMYMERYPGSLSGFVSIDSAPIQRGYYTNFDLWFLKHMEPMYKLYPNLVKAVANSCSQTPEGRANMMDALSCYTKEALCRLTGQGYLCLHEAIVADRPYKIDCPGLLICGTKDKTGYVKQYNKRWNKQTGIPLVWVEGAGHNSNRDRPAFVNEQIGAFLNTL